MTKFSITLEEADRSGVHPVMFEGRFIGVSSDPVTSAVQWLTRYKDAKPGDIIDVRGVGGVLVTYQRIEKDETPPPDEDEIGSPDDAPNSPRGKKKNKKKLADETEDKTEDRDENEAPAEPDSPKPEGSAAYQAAVRKASAAIIAAYLQATGRSPESHAADAAYEKTLIRAGAQHGSYWERVAAVVDAIVAVDRRRRGE
jgi:hypothetical protein